MVEQSADYRVSTQRMDLIEWMYRLIVFDQSEMTSADLMIANMKKSNCRLLLLMAFYGLFLILGAAIFSAIESPLEVAEIKNMRELKNQFLRTHDCITGQWPSLYLFDPFLPALFRPFLFSLSWISQTDVVISFLFFTVVFKYWDWLGRRSICNSQYLVRTVGWCCMMQQLLTTCAPSWQLSNRKSSLGSLLKIPI